MSRPRWLHWTDWSLAAKSAAALAMPLTLLVVALFFSYRLQQDIAETDADVRRALAIQAEIQTLHSLIAESAMGVRGYLLTGRDEFLAPYRAAREELPVTLTTLRRNIRDTEMKEHLEHIQQLLDLKLQSLDELSSGGRLLSVPDLQAHLIESKGVLDDLRIEIRAMNAREADLLAQYSDAASQALRRNLWVDALTSLLALITGVAAFVLLFSGVVWRVKRLTVNAERLAQGESLEALPAGRDELGLLAERLQNTSLLLAQRAAEARSANQAKSQFLSRTSHELRTPLNAILGFAQLLELDLKDGQQVAHVGHILAAGRHLLGLIDEVLDIARIESGEMKLEVTPQALAPLAQELRELIAPLASQHGVAVYLGKSLGGLAVQADRRRLQQVLLNLLSNAIKYNRAGGEVHLEAERQGEQVALTVSDTGVGIAPELLARLFTPFDRLDAEQGPVQGTGLGLAVSLQLALCMGGNLIASSKPGVGSTFSLHLPAATPPEGSALAITAASDTRLATRLNALRTVLVIEDNPSNLALIQALVARRPEWRLVTATDGAQGLASARELKPELILLDLNLPGQGGEAVLAELRADLARPHLRIVIVSADAQPETIARLRAAGADDYLTKPLAVPSVLALLDQTRT
ncbi:MAG: ATP-binding protein [Pseudomonadota bacterium]